MEIRTGVWEHTSLDLTVVIPTHNRLTRLRETLPRLLSSTSASIRFAISDNASTDGTLAYIRAIASVDSRVVWTRQPRNIGAVHNVLACFEMTETKYAMIVSDDDVIVGSYLDDVLEGLRANPDVGVVHSLFDSPRVSEHVTRLFYPPGARAAYQAFHSSGSMTGLTLNLNLLRRRSNHRISTTQVLYPQVEWALQSALEGGYLQIEGSGFRSGPWADSILSVAAYQGRGLDLGICERIQIAQQIPNRYLQAKAINDMASWAKDSIKAVSSESTRQAALIENAVTECFAPYTPIMGLRRSNMRVMIALRNTATYSLSTMDIVRRVVCRLATRFSHLFFTLPRSTKQEERP